MDKERQERLDEVCKVAVVVANDTRVPALSIVAQWAVESLWGATPCGKNYFGIKRASRHRKFVTKSTTEWFTAAQIENWAAHRGSLVKTGERNAIGHFKVLLQDEFADYESLEESVRDYAWLVSNGKPYAAAWAAYLAKRDVGAFIDGIAVAYSTSAAYSALVKQIAGQDNVRLAISKAREAQRA